MEVQDGHDARALSEQAARYRLAAEQALNQLDWCVGYLYRIRKPNIARVIEKNRSVIERQMRGADDCQRNDSGGRGGQPAAERYAGVLLEKISRDRYPSTTQMGMLESVAPPRGLVAYILQLMEKIENDRHPSIPMMQRVQRLVTQFGR